MIAVHMGDLHWSEKRLEEKIRCGALLAEQIEEIKPDVILVCGDIFDRPIRMEEPAAVEAVRFFSRLKNVAPVLGIRGNFAHDRDSTEILPYVNGEFPLLMVTEPSVFVLFRDQTVAVRPFAEAMGWEALENAETVQAVFFGLPYPSQSYLAQTAALSPDEMKIAVSQAITGIMHGFSALRTPPGIPRVFMFHGTVAGAKFSEEQRETGMDIILAPVDIGLAGFDLTAAGHLHFKQRIETSSGPIMYPGGMACTHWGESGPKGMWEHRFTRLVDTGGPMRGVHLESTHFDVGARPMQVLEVDFADPFFVIPDWAASGDADIQVRVKMTEADRQRLADTNWKEMMPNAASITVAPTVEQLESVRCEEVQQARTLRQKIAAWKTHQEQADGQLFSILGDTVLDKADLLEAVEADAIIASLQR